MRTSISMFTLAAVAALSLLGAGVAHAGAEIVPEPGSLALLTTGIAGLAGAAWWLRRK